MVKVIHYKMVLFVILCCVLTGCEKEEIPVKKRDPVSVDVLIAQAEDVAEEISVGGVVEADNEVVVSAEIGAVIEAQFYREGDRVRKGDLLLRFDDETFLLALTSREAELNKTRAILEKSREEIDRRRKLFERGFIAEEEVDETESQFKVARADVEVARSSLELAKRDVRKTLVRAPVTGIVTERVRRTGESVNKGAPIFRIAEYEIVRIVVSLSEKEVLSVKPGEPVKVLVGPFRGVSFDGKVKRVSVPVNPSEGVFPVEVVVPNSERRIKPGMVATVVFQGALHHDVIVVPRDIVSERLGESVVFVVNDEKAHARKVDIGKLLGFDVSVKAGVKPGDKVVVVGHELLFDGAAVTVRSVVGNEE